MQVGSILGFIFLFSSQLFITLANSNYLTKEEWIKSRLDRLRISRACFEVQPENLIGGDFCLRLNDEQNRQIRCENIWLTEKNDRSNDQKLEMKDCRRNKRRFEIFLRTSKLCFQGDF